MPNFWETLDEGEIPSVDVYLTMVDIASVNSYSPTKKSIILPDGHEIILNIVLDTDREKFGDDLRKAARDG